MAVLIMSKNVNSFEASELVFGEGIKLAERLIKRLNLPIVRREVGYCAPLFYGSAHFECRCGAITLGFYYDCSFSQAIYKPTIIVQHFSKQKVYTSMQTYRKTFFIGALLYLGLLALLPDGAAGLIGSKIKESKEGMPETATLMLFIEDKKFDLDIFREGKLILDSRAWRGLVEVVLRELAYAAL